MGLTVLLWMGYQTSVRADNISLGGVINQSTEDGTGPAVNNPSLNGIPDTALFLVSLNFDGSITAPGTYDLSGRNFNMRFSSAGAVEDAFSSVLLSIVQNRAFDQISVFACLASGSGCNQGNQLILNFQVLAASLNNTDVRTLNAAGLLPFELLEDDGVTDVQGSVTAFNYVSANAVPEPFSNLLVGAGLIFLGLVGLRSRSRNRLAKA